MRFVDSLLYDTLKQDEKARKEVDLKELKLMLKEVDVIANKADIQTQDLACMVKNAKLVDLQRGERLCTQDEEAEHMFLLLHGKMCATYELKTTNGKANQNTKQLLNLNNAVERVHRVVNMAQQDLSVDGSSSVKSGYSHGSSNSLASRRSKVSHARSRRVKQKSVKRHKQAGKSLSPEQ